MWKHTEQPDWAQLPVHKMKVTVLTTDGQPEQHQDVVLVMSLNPASIHLHITRSDMHCKKHSKVQYNFSAPLSLRISALPKTTQSKLNSLLNYIYGPVPHGSVWLLCFHCISLVHLNKIKI